MRPALLSRTLHKWLGLIVGIQLVFWTISGFYMVVVDLDFIHGDPLVRNVRVPLQREMSKIPFGAVAQRYEGVTDVSLRALPSFPAPVYEITTKSGKALIDASTGRQLSPLPEEVVADLARQYYAGDGQLAAIRLIESGAPLEIQSRPLPLWRVDFDDWLETSLYVHPDTGVLVTRRHRFWRWFDFLWMFHIMDFDTRTDMNNGLLRATTVAGLVTVFSGCWLLYFSFRRKTPARRTNQE
ncbi:PepSY domain-containing protein [Steroidobacter agaridevorans]|uniref:PepSY domain-containing protein n=1 Tax=Steroidobacter agaridevorans TaxID=2695856 RepID=UPI0013205E95|nr:PepSY domain-containing protein [Steroidobacter agaridevorans]GFE87709.1 hypothetical protein GCM10011488_26630 [Steroidobacter agaridevorans]